MKEYSVRAYCLAKEAMLITVFFQSADGYKHIQEFSNVKVARAFTAALDGIGFTKKTRHH